MKKILIVGSDRYAVNAAAQLGLRVCVIRGVKSANSGKKNWPANVEEINVSNENDIEEVVRSLSHAGHPLSTFTTATSNFEFSLVLTTALNSALGSTERSLETLVLMRDKALQKAHLRANGIRVARSLHLQASNWQDSLNSFVIESESAGYVLKPAASAATTGVFKLEDAKQLSAKAKEIFESGDREYVVEEFINGEEFLADGWIQDGKVGFLSIGKYSVPCLTTITNQAELRMYRCKEKDYPGLQAQVHSLAEKSLQALGYKDGLFHLEFFVDAEGSLWFSECAARRGGGAIEEEVRLANGGSLAQTGIEIAIKDAPTLKQQNPESPKYVGSVFPTLGEGTIISLPNFEEVRQWEGVAMARCLCYLGKTPRGKIKDTSTKDAMFVCTANSQEELDQLLDRVRDWFLDQTILVPSSKLEAKRFQSEVLGRSDLGDQQLVL